MFEFLNEVLFLKLFLRIIFNFFKIVFETVAKWTRLFQIFVYCCNTKLHKLLACNQRIKMYVYPVIFLFF